MWAYAKVDFQLIYLNPSKVDFQLSYLELITSSQTLVRLSINFNFGRVALRRTFALIDTSELWHTPVWEGL